MTAVVPVKRRKHTARRSAGWSVAGVDGATVVSGATCQSLHAACGDYRTSQTSATYTTAAAAAAAASCEVPCHQTVCRAYTITCCRPDVNTAPQRPTCNFFYFRT